MQTDFSLNAHMANYEFWGCSFHPRDVWSLHFVDGRPSNGEYKFHPILYNLPPSQQIIIEADAMIVTLNRHSVANLRHYLCYGGSLQFRGDKVWLFKPAWVSADQQHDVCTLCGRKVIDDRHLSSSRHTRKAQNWFNNWETVHFVPPPPPPSTLHPTAVV